MNTDIAQCRGLRSPPLAVTVTHTQAGHTVLTVAGELDAATVDRFAEQAEEALSRRPEPALILDLSDVSFCAARALGLLVRLTGDAHSRGIPLAIVAGRRAVVRPVEALGLRPVLPLHDHLTAALEHLEALRRLPAPRRHDDPAPQDLHYRR